MGLASHRTVAKDTMLDVLYCGTYDTIKYVIRQVTDACPSIASTTFLSWERLGEMAADRYPWTAPWALPLTKGRLVRMAGERLRRACPDHHYDMVLYPHDVVGQAVGLAQAAWPTASLLWIGDAFGLFVEKNTHLGLLGITTTKHPFLPETKPNLATACLPVDQTGRALNQVPLVMVSRQTLLETLQQVHDAFPELPGYLKNIRECHAGRPKVLLMTENHAECGCISVERECEMYADLLIRHARRGSIVYVKPHPGERFERHEHLAAAVAGHCDVVTLTTPFRFIPVELMPELILSCELCISMSYPRLSLKYLYDKDVLNPADPQFVERWFDPVSWRSYNNSYLFYEGPLAALQTWDGQGVLWSGDLPDPESRS